MIGRAFL